MKALKLFVTGMALFLAGTMQAQVSVSMTLPAPPPWGPVGYSEARYYYLPDVEAYYDVQSSMFIYYNRGAWIHRAHLAGPYRNYDLYGGYKVVMTDYHGNAPYNNFKEYQMRYRKGYRGEAQRTIRERPGRGAPPERMSRESSRGNKVSRGNDRNAGHGNNNRTKEDHGKGGGEGKRK